ncbi:Uncharacterized conserved protein YndB, AHSA1/START domain [Duganella sacchari]|uniref:Uncharacterized conserved protein YndB, AHSA1/START domain n=1 Tax=Duganella sacchari TaxID=551987 RepID=A0A1M7QKR6_9BURK|nr:SRPBCC domain-containing protein [Duganella sacchari]SHN31792.1 Uncharacterized conserved protein YndB, AHSA1/START domain [Duganella sacchari]
MQHFQHSILIDATPATVYAALTTLHGLRGWWSEDCDSDGDTIHMRFGQVHKDFRVTSAQPEREVRWLCSSTPGEARCTDEWVGTEPVFQLQCAGQGTRLDFEHLGLTPALSCYAMCEQGWHQYLESLRQYAVTGRGAPYPLATAEASA